MKEFPSFSQWKQIFKVLKRGEKIKLLILSLLTVGSLFFLIINFYFANTKIIPSIGGTYKEGILGQPRFINPIYGEVNDIDRSLISLVFSGLMTHDKNGKIVEDLADNYNILDDGKTYEFQLKDNVFWHDGKPLTTDDIMFTIRTIQNSDYKSPLRANWIDVDLEKVSSKSVRFKLKNPYNSFLETLTVKIIPEHIWQNISPENFILSAYNLEPIGSGPYKFEDIAQTGSGFIERVHLTLNRRYHDNLGLIADLYFHFFEKRDDLLKSIKTKEIQGFSLPPQDNDKLTKETEINQNWLKKEKFSTYYFSMPRYFALFFNFLNSNQKATILANENVRKALSYAIDKDDLIKKINSEKEGNILRVDSPIIPNFFGYNEPLNIYDFDIEKAKGLLDKADFKDNGNLKREKSIKKEPAFQFKTYLKVGSKNKEVNELQSCLSRLNDDFKNILKDDTNGTYSKKTESAITEFQKIYLPNENPTGETGSMTRKKLNELCVDSSPNIEQLKFTITTINQPQLLQVAELLKQYFQNVGVEIDINPLSATDLKTVIKNRNYDMLLYGEALGTSPDLYPFWHSSQKLDPGLNLSSYENKEVDKLLKEIRETLDDSIKQQKLEKLQDIITNNAPAIFLYNPDYIYFVDSKIKGIDTVKIIDPSKRFSNIKNWYIKTKRIWK